VKPIAQSALAWARSLAQGFTQHRLALISGGIAFFVALALAPTLFAFGAIASLFISPEALDSILQSILKETSRGVADSMVPEIVSIATQGSSAALTTSSVIAIFVAVYAASKVVLGMRLGVDSIFHVSNAPSGMVNRAIAGLVALLGLVGLALIVALLTIVPGVLRALGLASIPALIHVLTWLVGTALLYLAVRAFYRFGPHLSRTSRIRVPWMSWPVAFATAWIVVTTASFGLYVNYSGALGAAIALFGASIVFLVWLYFIVLGVLLGAQMLAISDRPANAVLQQPGP
jgi:membrane protein